MSHAAAAVPDDRSLHCQTKEYEKQLSVKLTNLVFKIHYFRRRCNVICFSKLKNKWRQLGSMLIFIAAEFIEISVFTQKKLPGNQLRAS